MTPNLGLNFTPLFDVEYLINGKDIDVVTTETYTRPILKCIISNDLE